MNATPAAFLRIRYAPPPTVARFMASRALYRGLMGPVGSGKSSACSVELMAKALAQAPDARGQRRTRFAVVRNTYRELKDTTLKTWLSWFPEDEFGPFGLTDMAHRLDLGLADGTRLRAEVLFRALDKPQDVKKLLSLELTGAWVNEARELPLSLVEALGDRVERFPSAREGGCSWAGVILDTNPPDTDHWWHRLETYGVDVRLMREQPLPQVDLDPEQLKEVLVNLVLNACDAMGRERPPRDSGAPAQRLLPAPHGGQEPAPRARLLLRPLRLCAGRDACVSGV
jgi:hypothetical protein